MPPSQQHRRTHNLLLISNLLGQSSASSPFTLVLDSLEQPSLPLVAEYVKRADAAKATVIFVSFETLRRPPDVDVFIPAWNQSLQAWQSEVSKNIRPAHESNTRRLLVIDSLNILSRTSTSELPTQLSSLINPTTSLLAVYHTDIPHVFAQSGAHEYSPSPLTLLRYLATTIFTTHSLHHVLARKAARDRSLAEPAFGLHEGVEGVLQGLGANDCNGVVLEMEHRRKSGRGVKEWYVLPLAAYSTPSTQMGKGIILLEDHPAYRSKLSSNAESTAADAVESTFELGLTEKQRRDREAVVLPYFDAQRGNEEGGRILYDMGVEDDFDEEEDEI